AGLLTVGPMVDNVQGLNGGSLNLKADDIAIVGPGGINNSSVTLSPRNAGALMILGASPGGAFGVDAAELAKITGFTLVFGSNTTGPVTVSAPMQRPSGTVGILVGPGQAVNVSGTLSAASGVQIGADAVNIGAPVTSQFGSVSIAPVTSALPISLGTE